MIQRYSHFQSRLSLLSLSAVITLLFCLSSHEVNGADPTTVPAQMGVTQAAPVAKIGVVNFRKVVESSKLGKQQQTSFEGMKNQMESLLKEREKTLTDLVAKLEDSDYMDGLTPEKELALKQQAYQLDQELEQYKQQFLQTLQQANARIIQMLNEDVSKAAAEVAQAKGLDLIANQEGVFHHKASLDVTDAVIQKLNESFDRDAKQKQGIAEAQKESINKTEISQAKTEGKK